MKKMYTIYLKSGEKLTETGDFEIIDGIIYFFKDSLKLHDEIKLIIPVKRIDYIEVENMNP